MCWQHLKTKQQKDDIWKDKNSCRFQYNNQIIYLGFKNSNKSTTFKTPGGAGILHN